MKEGWIERKESEGKKNQRKITPHNKLRLIIRGAKKESKSYPLDTSEEKGGWKYKPLLYGFANYSIDMRIMHA